MTGPGKDEKGARGFEGLGDLLSDEPETPSRPDSTGRTTRSPQADEPPPLPEEPPPLPRSARSPGTADTNRDATPPLPAEPPSQKSVPWGWIAAAAVGVLIVLVNLDDEPDAPSIAASTPSGALETPSSPSLPANVRPPSGADSPRPASAAGWNESRPPVGQDRALSPDELRYCLAESTRIDAMEKIVNEYNQADVDTFNRYVNDYNSRCASFRYRQSVLDSVQREVDAVRSRLGQEGRARLRGSQGASNQPRRVADPTVQAVQARLNDLGYNVGAPDGIAGTRTSEAIRRFQADQGMAVDGLASDRLLERLIRAAPRGDGGGRTTSSVASLAPPLSTTPSTREAQPQRGIASGTLSEDEKESLEAVCSGPKYTQGPAAYQACIDRQLAALQSAPRGHDMSSLNEEERQSLEAACSTAKYTQGPAAYNSCITRQLVALQSAPRARDTASLSEDERQSLEAACSTAKYTQGPAAYNACMTRQLSALQSAPRGHDLSGLNEDELQSLEAACSTAKYTQGPSAYNTCLSRQLVSLRSAPRAHDFSGLSQSQLQSLESACSTAKYTEGPAAYNRCLSGQLSSLRR
jgi:plasmid maintenance system killer protein